MANITDAEAIRFCNEVVRPLCEEVRALKIRIDAAQTEWFAGMNNVFASSGDIVADGRHDSEGVSILTAGDVTNAIAQITKTAAGQTAEWNDQVIQKPCVRDLP